MQLDIQNVSKRYGKTKYGLRDFSLTLDKGILGLLGPNGAGKSTLLKMIATVTRPTEGLLLLNKNNIGKDPNYMRKQLGFLPQDFGVYPNLSAVEFLSYIAAMKGVGGRTLKERIFQLLEGLNLAEAAHKPIGSYSGGMKQRVGIAQALLNDPKVVIFDEPTVGLDPEERVRFRDLISDLAGERIVILSSHIVSDIDTIADRIAIMKNGQLLDTGTPEEIVASIQGKVYETTLAPERMATFTQNNLVVSSARKNGALEVRYISGHPVPDSRSCSPNLEDAYLFRTKNPIL